MKPHEGFVDQLVHQQDCRRPLGIPRVIPIDRARALVDALPLAATGRAVALAELAGDRLDVLPARVTGPVTSGADGRHDLLRPGAH